MPSMKKLRNVANIRYTLPWGLFHLSKASNVAVSDIFSVVFGCRVDVGSRCKVISSKKHGSALSLACSTLRDVLALTRRCCCASEKVSVSDISNCANKADELIAEDVI